MDQIDDLVLGRGRLYFSRFADGTFTPGLEKFFGNVPSVQVSQANTKLDHYNSTQGLKVKNRSVTLQNDMTGTFSTDNVNKDNLALWFLGVNTKETVVAPAPVVGEPHVAELGAFIQLGASAQDPQGLRNVSAVAVKNGAAAITAAGNYEVDLVKGRIYIEPDATDILDGDALAIDYTPSAGTSQIVVASGTMIYGQLRFISDNPIGSNKDYFFPYVQITSSGNLDLIADTWQAATFAFEALKLNDATERLYIS
jgi:hypothetical protein